MRKYSKIFLSLKNTLTDCGALKSSIVDTCFGKEIDLRVHLSFKGCVCIFSADFFM